MKVAPWYVPKKCLINHAKRVSDKAVKMCIDVSKEIKPEDAQFIREHSKSLSKYASRHNCRMEFVPGENNNIQMNIKRGKTYLNYGSPFGFSYVDWFDHGSAQLPQHLSKKGQYALNYIRTKAGELSQLKNEKERQFFKTVIIPEYSGRIKAERNINL